MEIESDGGEKPEKEPTTSQSHGLDLAGHRLAATRYF